MRQVAEWSVLLYVRGALRRQLMVVLGRESYTVFSFEHDYGLMLGTSYDVSPDEIGAVGDRADVLIEEWRAAPEHRVIVQARSNPRAKLA